ncbi:MAG: hypothetical protein HQ559_17465 [Lentisphaerae bacterium]|nr:hypothetical protein [Lentisphaerota bacterium]
MDRTFVGFGFGPIQAGLFLYEANRSGNFGRLVVAEIVPDLVAAVRQAGAYRVNVATRTGVETHEVTGVEIFNPLDPADAPALADALAEASEISTALPSVDFYDRGETSVARLLGEAAKRKMQDASLPACVIYAAENNNHAAEILQRDVCGRAEDEGVGGPDSRIQFLNTVVGKMSGVVRDAVAVEKAGLASIVDGVEHAFLLEEFNRILVSEIRLDGFRRGIDVFSEKPDLMPFEEAKLYGHNATHALIGYLAHRAGHEVMSEVAADPGLMTLAREAFLDESGVPLVRKHEGVDELFTPAGYRAYAEDLLERMTNPYLKDRVDRVIRDPARKLGWDDRLVGTMRLAMDAGVTPLRYARGAAAAVELLAEEQPGKDPEELLDVLWSTEDEPPGRKTELKRLILSA